jgi:hypothetical protein
MRFSPKVEFLNEQPIFHVHKPEDKGHQTDFFIILRIKMRLQKMNILKFTENLSESSLHVGKTYQKFGVACFFLL